MPSDAIVQVRGLGKHFRLQRSWKELLLRPGARDVRIALEGIDLEVARGECFGILGQNGAGKSTLFKILATLVLPDAGSASVAGHDVTAAPEQVRQVLVPVIPAERSLYWRVSAEENLRLYAILYGLDAPTTRRRVQEVLQLVGLDRAGRKQVGLFSSGMKQRLLIGRALLGRPQVLLLDEPTRSLDPLAAREFRAFLRHQVRDSRGTTILLATHDHEEVTELCDRVAVLDEGKVIAVGETEALLASSRAKLCSIWTPDPQHAALERCVRAAGARILATEPVVLNDGIGWSRVRIELQGDEGLAADLLTSIVGAGVPVSRYTRDDLSLADLLGRMRAGQVTTREEQPV